MSSGLKSKPSLRQTTGEILSATYKKLKAEEQAIFTTVILGILFIAAAAYLSLAYNWPKFSRAEVFFAECVREMFQADNLVTPLYHGTPFFDKPILSYWFIAASYKLFGISHFTARIPAVLSALGTVALCAIAAKNLFGARSGTMAACALASSVMFMSFACLCMSDMILVFFDTLSLCLLYAALADEKRRNTLFHLAALSMGFAFITKGPVGIVLPAASFLAYLSITRQWNKISFFSHVLPCSLILLGAGVPWFMAAYRQNGAGALSYFFIHENLERYAGSTYDTHRPVWFMLVSLFSGMLPWSVFMPFALSDSVKIWKNKAEPITASSGQNRAQKHLYLWLWILTVIGFFSLSRGKIDYYALPAYPAAAILIGDYLCRACDNNTKSIRYLGWTASLAMLAAGIVAAFSTGQLLGSGKFTIAGFAIPAVLLFCAALMLACSARGEFRKAYKMLFVSVCLIAMAFSWQIYPWITSKQAVLKYIPYIKNLPPDSRVGVYTSLQNWIDEITFQTDCEPMKIESVKMAEQFMKAKSHCLLLIQESEYESMSPSAKGSLRIIEKNPFIPRSLNPIYFMKKGEKLGERTKLLLLSNY